MPAPANYERLLLDVQLPIARITLNNPPLNVIDLAMMEELNAVLAEIQSRPAISTIVFAGAGKCFSAGVDVAAHTPDRVATMLQKFHAVVRSLVTTNKVTIAAIHGSCLGGGAELAMVCDLVYTTEDARWGFPEIQLGCFPPVACSALSAVVGQKSASELLLTGMVIDGKWAAQIGLATRAVTRSRLRQEIKLAIERLSQLSQAVLAISKKSHYAWDAAHFDKGLARAEKIYVDELMKTEDAQEGIRAFMEKRKPAWKGR